MASFAMIENRASFHATLQSSTKLSRRAGEPDTEYADLFKELLGRSCHDGHVSPQSVSNKG